MPHVPAANSSRVPSARRLFIWLALVAAALLVARLVLLWMERVGGTHLAP